VNDALAGLEEQYGVVIGYRAHQPEIEVKVRAASLQLARRAADEAAARLGPDLVYGEGDAGLPEVVGGLLAARGLTLAVAESCTGGLVAELMTDAPGASAFFVGGAITYSNAAKTAALGVDPTLVTRCGAVSAEVARAMAEGARGRFAADLALSLTGIAGPTGGTPDKPVGLVHYALATPRGTVDRHLQHPGSRAQVRRRAAYAGLALIREQLRLL
jgi:nicotinamide-nucleotide amidase